MVEIARGAYTCSPRINEMRQSAAGNEGRRGPSCATYKANCCTEVIVEGADEDQNDTGITQFELP